MTALLVLIYVAFISLGIPDSLLGSAWPAMHLDLGVSVTLAGVLSVIISVGTVVSGLVSAKLIARFGTGRVTAFSVLMTAAALLGISLNRSFLLMALLCVPLGLGGGAVDAALNNYVALHYEARHMSWLHCFWGIGATIGPAMIGALLRQTGQWRTGYGAMALAQCALSLMMFLSLPLWRKASLAGGAAEEKAVAMPLGEVVRLPMAVPVFLTLCAYCGAESTMGLWGASYLAGARGVSSDTAATWISTFFLGITAGRFLAGLLARRTTPAGLTRAGILCAGTGVLLALLPLPVWTLPVAFLLVGLGFAPIYPAMLHRTPELFGARASQSAMGVEMAFAYVGNTLLPPLFGALSRLTGMWLMPVYVLILVAVMLACSERVNRRARLRTAEPGA